MGWTIPEVVALDPDYYDVLLEELHKEAEERERTKG